MAGSFGSQVGSAHVAIFPTMSGFRSAVNKEVKATGKAATSSFSAAFKGAGQRSGAQLGRELKTAFKSSSTSIADQVLSTFRKDVASAQSAVTSARRKMEDDAGRLRVAEERLQEVRGNEKATASQVAAAEERVASAQRRCEASTASYKAATERLTAAKGAQKRAEEEVAKATSRSRSAISQMAGVLTGPARSAVSGFSSSWKSATSGISSSSGVFSRMRGVVTSAMSVITAKATSGLTNVSTKVGSVFSSLGKVAGTSFSRLPTIVTGSVSEGFSGIGAAVKKAGAVIKSGASAAADGVKGAFSKMASGAKSAMSALAKAAAVGAAAFGAAFVATGKQALDAYASWEQLVGGVDTLFGDASAQVQQYAANAYRTAGMSANTYMETVTGFSASLLQGLGGDTARAAEVADMAVTDMSDNANKMGTSIDSIREAYQGFAKDNYDMLDNLKLGYGGTASEMARLINDSGVLGDSMQVTAENVKDVPFDKMIEAIHQVQTEMGITGTTSKEASSTIEGSVNSAKAAWENWLVSLGQGSSEAQAATTQLVDAVAVAAQNIVPRVGVIVQTLLATVYQGASEFVTTQLPSIMAQALAFVTSQLPVMVQTGLTMLTGLLTGVVNNLPLILNVAIQLVLTMANGIATQLPTLVPLAVQAVLTLATGIVNNLPQIIQTGITLLTSLAQGVVNAIPALVSQAPTIIGNLVAGIVSNLPQIINAGIDILQSLASGLVQAVPNLISQIPGIIMQIISAFANGDWGSIGSNIVSGIWSGISGMAGWLWDKVSGWAGGLLDDVKGLFGIASPSKVFAREVGRWIPAGIGVGMDWGEPSLLRKARGMAGGLVRVVSGAMDRVGVGGNGAGRTAGASPVSVTQIFNQPVQTPDEFARTMRMQDRYGIAAVV